MRFLIDAQLPLSLAERLTDMGHDARHVKSLPAGGDSSDTEVAAVADAESRVVVTKDADFVDRHLLHGIPAQVLRVTTGNIANNELLPLFAGHIDAIAQAFIRSDLIEFGRRGLVVHSRRRWGRVDRIHGSVQERALRSSDGTPTIGRCPRRSDGAR